MRANQREVIKGSTRVLLAFALIAFLTTVVAEGQVMVTVDVTGDAVPGATVTATAILRHSSYSRTSSG